MPVEASPTTTCQMLVVNEATGEDSVRTMAKSETLATGKEKGRCRLPLLAQPLCERVADREAETVTTSARIPLRGVRADLKTDHDHHAANSPSVHHRTDSLLRLNLITNGGPE